MGAPQRTFEITGEKDVIHASMPSGSVAGDWGEFESELSALYRTDARHIIINCGDRADLDPVAVRALMNVAKTTGEQKRVCLVGTEKLGNFLRRQGVERSLRWASGTQGAMVEVGLMSGKPVLDVKFINPFLEGAMKVLEIQASIKATPGSLAVRSAKDAYSGDISGIIAIVSDTFRGSVVISFPKATYLAIMSNMLGETYTEITDEIRDGVGELTNMIFGHAKTVHNKSGYSIRTAIPSVIVGANHSVSSVTGGGSRLVIPFTTDAGPFTIEIGIGD